MGKVKHVSMLPSSWKTALAHFKDDSERAGLEDSLCAVFSGTKHTSYSRTAVLPVVSHLAYLRTISHPLTGKLQSPEAQNEQGRFSWVLECWG